MITLDRILNMLQDSKWHHVDEIQKEISMPEDKLNGVLFFLIEQGYIDQENEKLRITSRGLKFLELPT